MTCSVESREDAVARLDEEVAELASKINGLRNRLATILQEREDLAKETR